MLLFPATVFTIVLGTLVIFTFDPNIREAPDLRRSNDHRTRYDIVIVGAGGAGMRAAIEAGPRAAPPC